jgi:hypothetical protein
MKPYRILDQINLTWIAGRWESVRAADEVAQMLNRIRGYMRYRVEKVGIYV